MARTPAVAGRFYPDDPDACRAAVDRCLALARAALEPSRATLTGGLVPHAGWVFSGPTAALTFAALSAAGGTPTTPPAAPIPSAPTTVCVLGAMHRAARRIAAAWPGGSWQTPLGTIAIDAELTAAILDAAGPGVVVADTAPHNGEHAIEVQLPFVQCCWPGARLVAIGVPPTDAALALGAALAAVCGPVEAVPVVASSDLTHYGAQAYGFAPFGTGPEAHAASKANDARLLDRVVALDGVGVLAEAVANANACGAGAVAAAVACAAARGARAARVLGHCTSAEVRPEHGCDAFVGYAAAVFENRAAEAAERRETRGRGERT